MIYTIKKGKHYSNFTLPKLYFSPKKITKKITFNENCRYDLQSGDQGDINKLFGLGYLPGHHSNSVRFGWRYDLSTHQIEIFAYWYKDKTRYSESLCFVEIGKEYTYCLESDKKSHKLTIFEGSTELSSKVIDLGFTKFAYFLKPYFGGNRTAPHKITIEFS